MDEFKFYDGISDENLNKAMSELKKNGHIIKKIEFGWIENKFIVFYNTKPITQPPSADLKVYTDVQAYYSPENPQKIKTFFDLYVKEYWYIFTLAGVFVLYYFFVFKKG